MPFLYILYSESLNKFYIGSTTLMPSERLYKHLCNHVGFTGKVNDWTIEYVEKYETIREASIRENQIKKWKSSIRIRQLIQRQK